MNKIPFNKPYTIGKELAYISDAIVTKQKLSGNGEYTKWCQNFFQVRYDVKKCLMTTSCTDALEMAAILLDIKEGDEIILPSFTFVSTANAFILRGAKLVFADSYPNNPNIDPEDIARKITPRTIAIIVVHYAGISCEMETIMAMANKNNIVVIEDAAQGVESTYLGKPLGTIGALGAFSFHETKNIISGEGGLLLINDPKFEKRAEIIWEKGTNRSAFFRGEIDRYTWVDVGSSFLPSEINSAYLRAQLESIEPIISKRIELWDRYYEGLEELANRGYFELPIVPVEAKHNGHIFFLRHPNEKDRESLRIHLNEIGINAVTHYVALESTPFFENLTKQTHQPNPHCPNSQAHANQLLRLPLFYELNPETVGFICEQIAQFYTGKTFAN